jgi:hypothetical protein
MSEKKNRIALLTVALGLWLIALALTFGFRGDPAWLSDIVSGFFFVIFGLFSLCPRCLWSGWAIGLVGVWLQMAPLLFWAHYPWMYINDTLVGAIAIIFCFLLMKKDEEKIGSGCPAGWSYNPSGWTHRIPTIGLALCCWFFSRYMAAFQLGYIDHVWDPFFTDGTLRVITSKISKNFPVSDAGLGALCYTLEFLLGWQGDSLRWAKMPWLVFAFAFLVIPVGIVSVTLIILQPVIVGAWCSWCLATAACMLLMMILTAGEFAAAVQFLKETTRKGDSLWQVFWKGGKPKLDVIIAKPPNRLFKGYSLGVTFPWNMLTSLILGIWLMVCPSVLNIRGDLAINNYIEGPLIVAFSVISFAEVFRSARYVNILFGLGLILAPWFVSGATLSGIIDNLLVGCLVVALAFRKGKISERYGIWEKLIV